VCGIRFVPVKERNRLRVSENRVLRRIFILNVEIASKKLEEN
jgi:hypothetical protein